MTVSLDNIVEVLTERTGFPDLSFVPKLDLCNGVLNQLFENN